MDGLNKLAVKLITLALSLDSDKKGRDTITLLNKNNQKRHFKEQGLQAGATHSASPAGVGPIFGTVSFGTDPV